MGHVDTPPLLVPNRPDQTFSDPLVQRLFPPLPKGVHWGLERTERALQALGDPHRNYPSIHVGGTNGKGSVTSTIASVLTESGLKVACYTSPHLISFRERLLIDGNPLPERTLLKYAEEVRDSVVRFDLTFFEAVTVLAMHAFAQEGVEMLAAEVGLGGRLDATNVLEPKVTAVTNVAKDHADYLGETLLEIAREKAGIMKPGVPFVTAESSEDLKALFEKLAAEAGVPLVFAGNNKVSGVQVHSSATSFYTRTDRWGDLRLATPLVGSHQATNTSLAVAVLEELPTPLIPEASEVIRGIAKVKYHGRDEVRVIEGLTWIFDVAHNPAGMHSLTDTLGRLCLPSPLVGLVSILKDKDWKVMLPLLLTRIETVVLTQAPSVSPQNLWDPQEAAEQIMTDSHVEVEEDFTRALQKAAGMAGNGSVVVTGSVHTVGSAMRLLGLDPLG